MKFTEEMVNVVKNSPYLTLVTINADGTPHPIIVGGKEQTGDEISIGIYKMDITQRNIAANSRAWVTAATLDGAPKGFRFQGTASVDGKSLIFTPKDAEVMI